MMEKMNFTDNDYGKKMNVSIWGFPGATSIAHTTSLTPSSMCHNHSIILTKLKNLCIFFYYSFWILVFLKSLNFTMCTILYSRWKIELFIVPDHTCPFV